LEEKLNGDIQDRAISEELISNLKTTVKINEDTYNALLSKYNEAEERASDLTLQNQKLLIDIDVYKAHRKKSTVEEDASKLKEEFEANINSKNAIILNLTTRLTSLIKLQEKCNQLTEQNKELTLMVSY